MTPALFGRPAFKNLTFTIASVFVASGRFSSSLETKPKSNETNKLAFLKCGDAEHNRFKNRGKQQSTSNSVWNRVHYFVSALHSKIFQFPRGLQPGIYDTNESPCQLIWNEFISRSTFLTPGMTDTIERKELQKPCPNQPTASITGTFSVIPFFHCSGDTCTSSKIWFQILPLQSRPCL